MFFELLTSTRPFSDGSVNEMCSEVLGEAETSAVLGRQLLAQAQASGDPSKLMLAHRSLGTSLILLGDFGGCREHAELQ